MIGKDEVVVAIGGLKEKTLAAYRMGIKKVIIPKYGSDKLEIPPSLTAYRVRNLREAIETAM